MIFKKNLLCIYDSFWVSFKIFIIIIGFQQFGYDVAWCGFPCVYSASGSFSLLSLQVSFSPKLAIFVLYFVYFPHTLKTSIICIVVVVQLQSCVCLFATLRTAASQASLSFTISRSVFKLMSIVSVMPSNQLILCHPLLLDTLCSYIPLPKLAPFIREPSVTVKSTASNQVAWIQILVIILTSFVALDKVPQFPHQLSRFNSISFIMWFPGHLIFPTTL